MLRRRAIFVAALVVPLAATGCVTTGPQLEERTRAKAVELVRQEVVQVDQSWQAAVRTALDEGRSSAAALAAGRRAVSATPVAHLTILESSAGDGRTGEVVLPVAVVDQVDGGGGDLSRRETVRMCVLLVTPVAEDGSAAVRNLTCPASLPATEPGLGTVTAVVPYA